MSRPAFDSVTPARSGGSSTVLSFSHTCSGNDRALLVGVVANDVNVTATASYGGQSMTLLKQDDPGATIRAFLFGLVNPPSGTNTVGVSFSISVRSAGVAASYTGAEQSSPFGTVYSHVAIGVQSSTISNIACGVDDGLMSFVGTGGDATGSLAPGADQTERASIAQSGTVTVTAGWADDLAPDSVEDSQWTWAINRRVVHFAVPVTGVSAPSAHRARLLVGVGL